METPHLVILKTVSHATCGCRSLQAMKVSPVGPKTRLLPSPHTCVCQASALCHRDSEQSSREQRAFQCTPSCRCCGPWGPATLSHHSSGPARSYGVGVTGPI